MILLKLSLAWLAGLGIAAAGLPQAGLAAAPLGLGASAGFMLARGPQFAAAALAAAALFGAGALRLETSLPASGPSGVAALNGMRSVTVRGTVADEPEGRPNSQRLVLGVDEVALPKEPAQASSGRVLVTAREFPKFAYGDRLQVTGRLEEPPRFESFDYREYLARRGIGSLMTFPQVERLGSGEGDRVKAAIVDIRNGLGEPLSQDLREPYASLARGMLLGQRAAIPADVNDAFNRSGISHLIAISGSNVTLAAGLALATFTWLLGRRRAVLTGMVFVAAFAVLVGGDPSVLRAAIMGIMMLGAVLAGRPGSSLTAVAFAAALLTAWQPLAVFDVAFQLSFAATLGLILLSPHLTTVLRGVFERAAPAPVACWLAETVSVTTAASVAVFPITAASFERVSLVTIPANILGVPLFGATIITSFATAVAGLVSADAAEVLARVAEAPLMAMVEVARRFSSVPYASVHVPGSGLTLAAACYTAIALVAAAERRGQPSTSAATSMRWGPLAAATVVVAAAAGIVWFEAISSTPANLVVTVLDVGQGDSILITTPAGHRILVDGGPSSSAELNALGRELAGGAKRVDLVVLTHPQEDHVAGLVAVSQRYDVRAAAASGVANTIGSYQAWLAELEEQQTPVTTIDIGETADLGRGVRLDVLGPPEERLSGTRDDLNSNSVVLRLTYGSVSFLLAGDLSQEGERALLSATGDVHATVLKVGHHGSEAASTSDFVSAVRPAVAVISVGGENVYGHPSPTTLLRLADTPIFRTDRNGSVRFETDGRRLFVRPERGSYQLVPVSAR